MSGWVRVSACPMYVPAVWHAVTPPPVRRTCNCFPQPHVWTATGTGTGPASEATQAGGQEASRGR